jgi:shikimate kinase
MSAGPHYTRVFLTGFMGSGKSTVGPILANSVGYDFVDLDAQIEAAEGRSIRDIFRSEGEAHFRALEREEIARLCTRSRLVVALGGGTLVQPETHRLIRASGVLVYLKLSPDQLFQRVRRNEDRPLLSGPEGQHLTGPELKERIAQLYRQREELYASADIIVESDARSVGVTVERIVRELRRHLV